MTISEVTLYGIKYSTCITELNLSCNNLKYIDPNIKYFINLQILDLSHSFITKIENLNENLEELNVSYTDIVKIENLNENLEELNVGNTDVFKIENLNNKLKILNLSYTNISKIENLNKNLEKLIIIDTDISKIENLNIHLQKLYIQATKITKLENLPYLNLLIFLKDEIKFVDNVSVNDINFEKFNIQRYNIIRKLQRRMKIRYRIKTEKIKIIQKCCENWLFKPICDDGTIGISLRIGLRKELQLPVELIRHIDILNYTKN